MLHACGHALRSRVFTSGRWLFFSMAVERARAALNSCNVRDDSCHVLDDSLSSKETRPFRLATKVTLFNMFGSRRYTEALTQLFFFVFLTFHFHKILPRTLILKQTMYLCRPKWRTAFTHRKNSYSMRIKAYYTLLFLATLQLWQKVLGTVRLTCML